MPLLLLLMPGLLAAQIKPPLVIPEATISPSHIAFIFGGQIWEIPRIGGHARRLTEGPETHRNPVYSPDGSQILFTRSDVGENNIYVMPARGGEMKPLTYHPGLDMGWAIAPNGKSAAFSSNRGMGFDMQLHEVTLEGGLESRIPVPTGVMATYAPDGSMIAYVPRPPLNLTVNRRNERGGTRSRIEIYKRFGGTSLPITPKEFNSLYPMWVGNRIYFIQDRLGSYNLASFDRATRRIHEHTKFPMSGITFASSDGRSILFIRDGRFFVVDPKDDQPREIPFSIDEAQFATGMDERASRKTPATRFLQSFTMGPDGKSVVIEARGEALVKPVGGGPAVNHTKTPGVAEREPAISPDGQWLAYFSDETGEYQLHLRSLKGGSVRKHAVELKPGYYSDPFWSPDSRTLAFSDRRMGLWTFDVDSGKSNRIDVSNYVAQRLYNPSWSPDSRYLAYAKALPNHHRAIVVWERATGKKTQLTDAFSHAEFPNFDASGRYLYFSGSANARNASASDVGWALLSDFDAQPLVLKRLFAMVLHPQDPSPVLPFGAQANPLASYERRDGPINWESAQSRVVPLGMTPRDVAGLYAAGPGVLLVQVNDWDPAPGRWLSQSRMYRMDLRRPAEFVKVAETALAASMSSDRSAVVIGAGGSLQVFAPEAQVAEENRGVATTPITLTEDLIDVDPAVEWRQLYREAWRIMREHFYDPNHHGQDLGELEQHFAAFLPGLIRRTDLNTLLRFAFGEVSISHLQVSDGDLMPSPRRARLSTGLLGADWKVENGRYRLAKILRNGHFLDARPMVRAPLDQPGVDAREGDYLIEVEGKAATADQNIHLLLRGTAMSPTRLKFASDPTGVGAREVTVVPLANEGVLRTANWAETNRKWVDEKSGGKLVYVHVNAFDEDGFDGIYRTVNGLRPGQGLVWDQRMNGGGITGDSLVQMLLRKPMLGYVYPHGEPFDVPAHRVDGPVVLIADHQNGSAAETFALMFKAMKVGKIVGTSTYGAGVGVALAQQRLIDGGRIGIPNRASHNPLTGEWEIENRGVTPDVEVDISTADFVAGRDPQLEKAVEVAMKQLTGWKVKELKRPKFPLHPLGGG